MVQLIGTSADDYKISLGMGFNEQMRRIGEFYEQARHMMRYGNGSFVGNYLRRSNAAGYVPSRDIDRYNRIVDHIHPKMQSLDVRILEGDIAAIMHKMAGGPFVDGSINNDEFERVVAQYDIESGKFNPIAKENFFIYLKEENLGHSNKRIWPDEKKETYIASQVEALDLLERLLAIQLSKV